jgi:hypothetical protein
MDEITLFDYFMNRVDYDAMDAQRKQELIQTFMMLMACAEGNRLDMDKVGRLLQRISGGKLNFDDSSEN